MKILICGATGLIGSALTELCIQENHTVHYLTTRKSKIEQSKFKKGFHWNPAEGEIDTACLKDVDVIINLSGANIAKRWSKAYKEEIMSSRVDTANILFKSLRNMENHTIKQYVSASGIAIYPDSLTENYTEDTEKEATDFLGKVVKQWELHANQFKSLGISVTILRTGLVFSTKGGALAEMAKPIKYGAGAAIGSGKQWQSWIHIEDLARLFVFIIENRFEGIFNAVSPNPVSNSELTKIVARVLNKPLILPNIPKFVMKLVLGDMHVLLFDSHRVSSQKIENSGFSFKYHHLEPAIQATLL